MRVLLETRAALDGGHAGIPQAARLLFHALAGLDGVEVEGLIQSSNKVLARGLPDERHGARRAMSEDRRIDLLARLVVSLQQHHPGSWLARTGSGLERVLAPGMMMLRALLGRREPLTRFEADRFRDFVWRAFFAKTLPTEDFDTVTNVAFRVARVPWSAMHAGGLLTRKFGRAVYPRLDTTGFDVLLAETPYPGRVSGNTKLVVRYHDAFPLLMPHTITDRVYHQASHYHSLLANVRDGAWFVCVSEATRRDLLTLFPQAEARAVTIPNMVSHHYFPEDSSPRRIGEIMRVREHGWIQQLPKPEVQAIRRSRLGRQYLLMVSTIEPRKNHLTLLAAWEQLRAHHFPTLELVTVGMLGWDHESIIHKYRPWLRSGIVHMLEDVPAPELRLLFKHARATVCPSFGEGFDYSGVEAMRCGGVVVASDIPVHRDIYRDAAEYFNAYSTTGLVQAVKRVIDADAVPRRNELIEAGQAVSADFNTQVVLPQWRDFLLRLSSS